MSDHSLTEQPSEHLASKGVSGFKKYPKLTIFWVGLLLLGSAMAALGITAVNRADSEIEKGIATSTLVEYEVSLGEIVTQQASLLENVQLSLFNETNTVRGDTPKALLERLGVRDDEDAQKFLRNDPFARMILSGKRSVRVSAVSSADGKLEKLIAGMRSKTEKHFNRITITRAPDGTFSSISETVPVQVHERVAVGEIKYSLYGATDEIGLPINIAYELADIFSSRIDFTRQLRKGDSFQLIYESYEADGVALGTGRILAAVFKNGPRTLDAVYFQTDPNRKGSYYTLDGKSLKTVFLDFPLEYTRVSSNFGGRMHPIKKVWREHKGIDYAAPTGTPIRTVGDGVVEFAGVQNGYGNFVVVRHDKNRTTAYAHMSRIDVTKGQILEQGDVVGAVGQTGWATGPHLHFEYRENSVHKDPTTLSSQTEAVPIPEHMQAAFEENAQNSSMLLARMADLMTIAKSD